MPEGGWEGGGGKEGGRERERKAIKMIIYIKIVLIRRACLPQIRANLGRSRQFRL